MDPQWDDMRIFLAVARAESLSEAGRRLRVDPATVGRRVARLEEALGAPLLRPEAKTARLQFAAGPYAKQ